MKKKEITLIGVIAGVLFLGGGGGLIGKFYHLLGRTEKTEEQVGEIKKEVDKNEAEIDDEENINLQQQGLIDSNTKGIQQMQDNQAKFQEKDVMFLEMFKEVNKQLKAK